MTVIARDVMNAQVVCVPPEMPRGDIAKLLLEKRISAVPVIDQTRAPIGMVSEGDLIGRKELERETRMDWWLAVLAGDDPRRHGIISTVRTVTAREIMSSPVVTIGENTDIREIARLLMAYRIKRVPVICDGRIVGIVSRADLLRGFASERAPDAATPKGGLAAAIARLDEHFLHPDRARHGDATATSSQDEAGDVDLSAADFRKLMADFEERKAHDRESARHAQAVWRKQRVAKLIDTHISDESWRNLLHRAREAAEQGHKELMILRFPSQLCNDGGRAINVAEEDWAATLRGEPAEIYLRWERDLKPHGFHLATRVLEFPGGLPGDIGLFLIWGEPLRTGPCRAG